MRHAVCVAQQSTAWWLLTRIASTTPALGARTSTVTLSVSICSTAQKGQRKGCDEGFSRLPCTAPAPIATLSAAQVEAAGIRTLG